MNNNDITYAHWNNPITVWERDTLNGGFFITSEVPCSNCGYTVPFHGKSSFCAGCGAKMDDYEVNKQR